MSSKPIPRASYPCHFCSDEYSHPADELSWSDAFQAWICDNCWREYDEHWITDEDGDNESFCDYGISLEEELNNRAKNISIVFSKNIDEIPVDIPVLILLIDESIHTSIKRQSTFTYDKLALEKRGHSVDWSEDYFYFDIVGTVDTKTQEPCYINYEKVVGFTDIPKIIDKD
jgi:hypothetical protein